MNLTVLCEKAHFFCFFVYFLSRKLMMKFFEKTGGVLSLGQIMTMQVAVSISRIFIRLFRMELVFGKLFIYVPRGACVIDRPCAPMFENSEWGRRGSCN